MHIMQLRFGINGNEKEKTQKEVADMLGISQSYISRLEKKIMKKMRKEIMSKTGWKIFYVQVLTKKRNINMINKNGILRRK